MGKASSEGFKKMATASSVYSSSQGSTRSAKLSYRPVAVFDIDGVLNPVSSENPPLVMQYAQGLYEKTAEMQLSRSIETDLTQEFLESDSLERQKRELNDVKEEREGPVKNLFEPERFEFILEVYLNQDDYSPRGAESLIAGNLWDAKQYIEKPVAEKVGIEVVEDKEINQSAKELFQRFGDNGDAHDRYVITNNPIEVALPFLMRVDSSLDEDNVYATRVTTDETGNHYTRGIEDPETLSLPGKLRALSDIHNRYITSTSPFQGDSYYFGDSASDVPGFLMVDNPVLIGKDESWLEEEIERFYNQESVETEPLKNLRPDYPLESAGEVLEGKNVRSFESIHQVNQVLEGGKQ